MYTFRLYTTLTDAGPRKKVKEVQLCLEEHLISDEGLPALTSPCVTEEEVEEEFESVVADIRKKKDEAKAMLQQSDKRSKRP